MTNIIIGVKYYRDNKILQPNSTGRSSMKPETEARDIQIITISIDKETLEQLIKMMVEEHRNRSNMTVIAIKEAFQRRFEPRPEIAP